MVDVGSFTMERNPFVIQGQKIPKHVREIVLDKWLDGSKPCEIGRQMNIERETVSNIVNRWLTTGSSEGGVGGNRTRTARTDDVIYYTEFCKRQQPSILAEEIQKQLVDNLVVLPDNLPSQASISRALTKDLGYSYKKLRVVPRESLTDNVQEKLARYLAICSVADPNKMFFFDESSVIKTTGNRTYGHAPFDLLIRPALFIFFCCALNLGFEPSSHLSRTISRTCFGIFCPCITKGFRSIVNDPTSTIQIGNFVANLGTLLRTWEPSRQND